MKARLFFLSILLIFCSSFALAGQIDCPQHYLNGQAPTFLNEKLSTQTQQICYEGYGLIHSGITRTALISAEHLTKERLFPHHLS
jgi:endonuclease G, mitochondrial